MICVAAALSWKKRAITAMVAQLCAKQEGEGTGVPEDPGQDRRFQYCRDVLFLQPTQPGEMPGFSVPQ